MEEDYIELKLPTEYRTSGFEEPVFVYNTTHFEMIEDLGALRHVEGATYPSKGIPMPDSLHSVNIIKSILKEMVRFLPILLFIKKDRVLKSFNTVTNRVLKDTVVPHTSVPHKYLCPAAFGAYSVISNFLVSLGVNEDIAENTGYNIAQIFQHDDAWRYRLQDVATEIDINKLKLSPRKEMQRVLEVFCIRQDVGENGGYENVISIKVKIISKVLSYILLLPKYKKAFISITEHIKVMEYDEADWYWVCLRGDYNYGGKTIQERISGVVIPKKYLVVGDKVVSNK